MLIWPLSQEQNIIWISCNWIFCSLWSNEEFGVHYNLIEACWIFWHHVALHLTPCTWLIYVSTLGEFIRPQWTVGYLQSFYNFTRQVDLTCPLGNSPIPNLYTSRFDAILKIRRRDGVESLTTLEEGEFKVPIDGCIRLSVWHP